MIRSHVLLASVSLVALAACTKTANVKETEYPKMVLGQGTLDFGQANSGAVVERTVILSNDGGMPMGMGSTEEGRTGIDIGPGMDGFSVRFDKADISCPTDGASTARRALGSTRRSVDVDTGNPPSGGGGGGNDSGTTTTTGGGVDTGGGGTTIPEDDRALLILDPGCSIPITVSFSPVNSGDVWGSLLFESITAPLTEEQESNDELPDFLRDPIHFRQMVYLHGTADSAQGSLTVSPPSYDFGYVYPGTAVDPARVAIANVGSADLTLTSVTLSESCDGAFTIVMGPAAGEVLPAGESTLVEVEFNPEDTQSAYCELNIVSDDVANPTTDVSLKGNSGSDPNNSRPTVEIRSPSNGYVYTMVGDLTLELNVFDKDQPANTLTCKVKSMLQESSIASCTPTDESGHVYVAITSDLLDDGVDTLTVTVTDGSQISASASVSVLVNANFPEDDDDGDGFSPADEEYPDCDDSNRNTYPSAAEVFDESDNDCDGTSDEGTDGYDDDEDGFSEVDGDCNDADADTYPGGDERGDSADNDCDGIIDEETSLYDDDGDGYADVNGDCNDANSLIHPGAKEECDGVDNDCDTLMDTQDGCVSTDAKPVIVGGVKTTQTACESGDVISASIFVFDADGQTTLYSWNSDDESGPAGFDNPTAQTVNWTCPELPDSSAGKAFHIYTIVQDPDSNQDWADETIAVYPNGYGLYDPYVEVLPVK